MRRQHNLNDFSSPLNLNTNSLPLFFLSRISIGGVKEIWLNRDLGELPDLVEERFKLCNKLEGAEAKMIKNAYKKYRKSEKKNKGNGQSMEMINERDQERDLSSAAVSSFVDAKDRPTHKLGFLGLLGEKVSFRITLRSSA